MASRSLGTLTVDLVAKIGGFTAGMNQAERQADRTSRALIRRKREIEREWKKVGGIVAAGFGLLLGGSIIASVRSTTNELIAMGQQAQKVGMQADIFSGYAAAAQQADVETQTLTRTLQRLAMATAGGSNQFERLGIDPASLKDTEDALRKVADAFARMPDGAEKVDIARRLMGRAGTEMIGLLNEGSEGIDKLIERQRQLGNVISGETFAALQQYQSQMDDMQSAVTGFRRQIGVALIPAMTALAKAFAEDLAPATDTSKQAIADWGSVAETVIGFTADTVRSGVFAISQAFQRAGLFIAKSAAQMRQYLPGGGGFEGAAFVEEAYRDDLAQLDQALQNFNTSKVRDYIKEGAATSLHGFNVAGQTIAEGSTGGGKASKAQRDPVLEAGKQYIEQLQRQIALGEKATEVEKVLYEIQRGRLQGLNSGVADQLVGLAEQLDAMKQQKELAEALESVHMRTLELQGRLGAAAAARFDKENEGIRKVLEAAGEMEALSNLDRLRDQEIAQARINELVGQYRDITAQLQIQEDRIAISQQVGALGELDALMMIGEERQKAIAQMKTQLALFNAMNDAALSDAQRLQIEQLRLELEKLEAVADPLADKFNTVIKDSFAGAFADFITGTKSAKEAFRSFANSVMQEMARMMAQQLASKIFGNFFGGLIPSFDVGTPYVPRDTLAMVHKGERILTADENRDFMKGGDTKIINVMDPSVVGDYLGTDAGESLIINVMQRNRQLIGV